MPSGAKKRKAAKKKLQKEAHNYFDGSHSLGNDTTKSHEERESDGDGGERESSEEPNTNNQAEVKEEASLSEQNISEFPKEEKSNEVLVNVEEDDNGESKRPSSSSSSSEDDDVAVEKEKQTEVVPEICSSSAEESIPVEESVKEVLLLPNETNTENENENQGVENSVLTHRDESEMKQNLGEDSSGVIDFVEKIGTTVRNGKGLLPQSSGGDNLVKETETHKYVEEKPLISSSALPVRRTSWTNCCGLFEVFTGGDSR